MRALGHERFMVAGHDRGGRVAYRLALDHPEAVRALVPVDIIPTGELVAARQRGGAMKTYHWPFLAQPHPLPETLIGKDRCSTWSRRSRAGPSRATCRPSRRRPWRTTAPRCRTRRASMPSARTIAPAPRIDRQLDDADLAAGRKIACPTLVL